MPCCGRKVSSRIRRTVRRIKTKAVIKALAQGPALKTFLMCRPSFYGIKYQINPWMSLTNQANQQKAIEQWNNLCERIKEHGGAIRFIKDQPDCPDLVFTANGGYVFDNKQVVIANFRHAERKAEEEWFVQWFADEGYTFHYPDLPFEGAGDCLSLGDTLFCGYGFRSDPAIYDKFNFFWKGEIIRLKLVDPCFYHLDTCFCPLDGGDYMAYPGAFDKESWDALFQWYGRKGKGQGIMVCEAEAKRFACNAVCLGKTVILPSECPQTVQLLEQSGYKAVPVDMSEFIKSGGACKCLTLAI